MTGAALIAITAVGAISVYGIMERKIGGVEVRIGICRRLREMEYRRLTASDLESLLHGKGAE